jgi:hypothetical protein
VYSLFQLLLTSASTLITTGFKLKGIYLLLTIFTEIHNTKLNMFLPLSDTLIESPHIKIRKKLHSVLRGIVFMMSAVRIAFRAAYSGKFFVAVSVTSDSQSSSSVIMLKFNSKLRKSMVTDSVSIHFHPQTDTFCQPFTHVHLLIRSLILGVVTFSFLYMVYMRKFRDGEKSIMKELVPKCHLSVCTYVLQLANA